MATKAALRPLSKVSRCCNAPSSTLRPFSVSHIGSQQVPNSETSNNERYTHFGYENVKEEEKASKGRRPYPLGKWNSANDSPMAQLVQFSLLLQTPMTE